MLERLSIFLYSYSFLGVFLALIGTGLGVPIPEDIILITGGVIAARSDDLFPMIAVGMAGVLTGDLIIYGAGYLYGETLLKKRPFVWLVTPARLRKVRGYYRKYGYWAIFISRFLAGLRATSFLMAGLSHVPAPIFFLADGMAALISVPLLVFLGYYFSDNIQAVTDKVKEVQEDTLLVAAVLIPLFLLYRWWRRKVAKRRRAEALAETPANKEG